MSSNERWQRIVSHLQSSQRDAGDGDINLVNKLLDVIENDIIPKTQRGVSNGNKIFGAAILDKNGNKIMCDTNKEIECPLYHGEVSTIKTFYEKKLHLPPHNISTSDCIFLSTHEPCSMCLSAITWSGFKQIFYFFDYQKTTNTFNIPHDINIFRQVFDKKKNDYYNQSNEYFDSFHIISIIHNIKDDSIRNELLLKVERIQKKYDALSMQYQESKSSNQIPLN